jgi:hypothetical protein
MRQREESKQFFFAKKNQKTFVYKALALPKRVRQMDKSFCFFFQKEVLSSCQCVSLKATWYKWLLCANHRPFKRAARFLQSGRWWAEQQMAGTGGMQPVRSYIAVQQKRTLRNYRI